jgi:hypothetical protein
VAERCARQCDKGELESRARDSRDRNICAAICINVINGEPRGAIRLSARFPFYRGDKPGIGLDTRPPGFGQMKFSPRRIGRFKKSSPQFFLGEPRAADSYNNLLALLPLRDQRLQLIAHNQARQSVRGETGSGN